MDLVLSLDQFSPQLSNLVVLFLFCWRIKTRRCRNQTYRGAVYWSQKTILWYSFESEGKAKLEEHNTRVGKFWVHILQFILSVSVDTCPQMHGIASTTRRTNPANCWKIRGSEKEEESLRKAAYEAKWGCEVRYAVKEARQAGRRDNRETIKDGIGKRKSIHSLSSFFGVLCLGVAWVGESGNDLAEPGAGLVGWDQWLRTAPTGTQ